MEENDDAPGLSTTFQWDENSQLYYHASTGFYHDPHAGWYYSSSDGRYYRFEDGKYVPLESYQEADQDQPELYNASCDEEALKTLTNEREICSAPAKGEPTETSTHDSSDNSEFPPPPSEWLQDTLIDMYLSGHPRQTNALENNLYIPEEENDNDMDMEELEEGEWIPDDPDFLSRMDENTLAEGMTEEEADWLAQYGQVSQSEDNWTSDLQTIDLWDWALVKGTKKDGRTQVAKLIGKKHKRNSNLHPSVPSGGVILKTAPISEVYLDLVRVTSGRVYKLRIPSLQYLSSLSAYDASNPTKDWGFPQLTMSNNVKNSPKDNQKFDCLGLSNYDVRKEEALPLEKLGSSKKDHIYRDRAAERRTLHGGYGIGPGQKRSITDANSDLPSSPPLQHEDASAESLNISFGEGSYARKIMQGMGWKEGDTLGQTMKGLSQPLQAIGNKGTAGLGWDNGWRK